GYKNKELAIINKTSDFYDEVSKLINDLGISLEACKIDLFDESLEIELLYRMLDKHNLLGIPLENKDHNVLNKGFYNELLYIMGLEEVIENKIPVIKPLVVSSANYSNLINMVRKLIEQAKNDGRIDRKLWNKLGDHDDERSLNISLELILIWINRILFLKLLEAQLIKYHTEDHERYKFLKFDPNQLSIWGDISRLFFEILARPLDDPNRSKKEIPYLNSALFEITEYEKIVSVDTLNDKDTLDIYKHSILTDKSAKPVLRYLLEFLDCYHFGRGDDQAPNDRLINASVLGLIFEKLNGYKDGAVYTPSFITMGMSRDALHKTVVQKFNETYDWECIDYRHLKNQIVDHKSKIGYASLNETFNKIKICDPAVGSGHFLVSVLNELLYIKQDLKILVDKNEERIDCEMDIVSDELLITYEGKNFTYQVDKNNKPLSKTMQTIQETLFHEKEKLIENCLFGVDINPKSAYICQLRLWIELLKNTYYIQNANKIEDLQTLPNIDINIKIGNSLVSRFNLKHDFSTMISGLSKQGITVRRYRQLVNQYKNTHDKQEKQGIKDQINEIKTKFRNTFLTNEDEYEKLHSKFRNAKNKFENIEYTIGVTTEQIDKARETLEKAEQDLEKVDGTYINSMEWIYEFPEVLDDEGKFIGFDLIIGNPPYIQLQSMNKQIKSFYQNAFATFASTGDIYQLFIELGLNLIRKTGISCLIVSNKWMRAGYGVTTRKYLHDYGYPLEIIDMGSGRFEHVTVDVNILMYSKRFDQYQTQIPCYIIDNNVKDIIEGKVEQKQIRANERGDAWIILNEWEAGILDKMHKVGKPLKDWDISMNSGIKTGFNNAFIIDGKTKDALIAEDPKSAEILKPLLQGRDIRHYSYEFSDKWLINTHNGIKSKNIDPIDINDYPAIKKHLDQFIPAIEKRQDQGNTPYNLRNCAYLEDFDKPKIMFNKASKINTFYLDDLGYFGDITTYIIVGKFIDYLYGILNSMLFKKCYIKYYSGGGIEGELTIFTLEQFPIPIPTKGQERTINALVDTILDKKQHQLSTDKEEQQIDQIVYEMYGLSEEEIRIIGA
ncbi:MAG: Eco57I restriction-modification methylase domain-containing protein, partial [Brevinema sp.]